MYVAAFADSADAKNLLKTKAYKNKTPDEQADAYLEKLYLYALSIEKEKLFYFSLVYQQTTVIITAPTDNKEQKEFLGYDWSNRKGNEGIQIITPGGKMYDDADRAAEGTLASFVRNSYSESFIELYEGNKEYVGIATTCNMLDFSRVNFNKALKLSAANSETILIHSIYPKEKLGKIAPYVEDRLSIADIDLDTYVTTDNMLKNKEGVVKYSGTPNIQTVVRYQPNDILVSNIRPYLKKIWLANTGGGCSPDVLVFRVKDRKTIIPEYLYYVLSLDVFFDYMMADHKGTKMPRGDKALIPQFGVPVPPIPVQQKVVDECSKIDEEYNTTRMSIEAYRQKITDLFAELDVVMSTDGGVQTKSV